MAESNKPQQSQADAPKTKAYRALTPIEHDGKPYAVGKTLRLDDEAAARLLSVGAIALAGKEAEEA